MGAFDFRNYHIHVSFQIWGSKVVFFLFIFNWIRRFHVNLTRDGGSKQLECPFGVQGRFTCEARRAEFDGMDGWDGMGRNIRSVL